MSLHFLLKFNSERTAFVERTAATEANEGWSMDFMSDELYDGRRIRLLTLVDNFTRESLAIEVNDHLGGHRVVEVLQRLRDERSLPKTIRVDNGPEFISKVLGIEKGASPSHADETNLESGIVYGGRPI